LSPRERLFAHCVVLPGISQTEAARQAGYGGQDDTLSSQATRLIRRPKVAALVEQLRAKQTSKIDSKAQKILDELEHLALARLSRVVKVHPDSTPSVSILPIEDWEEHERAALSKIDVEKIFDGAGKDRIHVGDIVKLEMKAKQAALDTLAKHHGLVKDKLEVDVTVRTHAELIAEAARRRAEKQAPPARVHESGDPE
jgi:phage terminase small subunit